LQMMRVYLFIYFRRLKKEIFAISKRRSMYAHVQKSTSVFTYNKCTRKEKKKRTKKQDRIIHSLI